MKLSTIITFVAGLLFSVAALAMELDDAKNMGVLQPLRVLPVK